VNTFAEFSQLVFACAAKVPTCAVLTRTMLMPAAVPMVLPTASAERVVQKVAPRLPGAKAQDVALAASSATPRMNSNADSPTHVASVLAKSAAVMSDVLCPAMLKSPWLAHAVATIACNQRKSNRSGLDLNNNPCKTKKKQQKYLNIIQK